MAGHSHWAGIKHRKGAQDKKRGIQFSKCARHIISAARAGGGDPTTNLALRYAIEKAKEANMPKDNISRAIKRGTGEIEGEIYESIMYEGYGPEGVAIIVQTLTENKTRTIAEVRHRMEKNGGRVGTNGCVSWNFKQLGLFTLNRQHESNQSLTEDQLLELVIEVGGSDIRDTGSHFEVFCDPSDFHQVLETLDQSPWEVEMKEITLVPGSQVQISNEKDAKQLMGLVEALEDLEDVQQVISNADIDSLVLEKVMSSP